VDPLYEQAVRIVLEERVASISLVQRRLRLSYRHVAEMFEKMEAQGLVSSFLGSNGFRELLILPFKRRLLLQQLRRREATQIDLALLSQHERCVGKKLFPKARKIQHPFNVAG